MKLINGKSRPKKAAQLNQPFLRLPYGAAVFAYHNGMPLYWSVYLFLFAFIDQEDQDGNIYAHCSRAVIADALGVDAASIKNAVRHLKVKGAVETVKRGHNGRSTVYKLPVGGDAVPYPTAVGDGAIPYPTDQEPNFSGGEDERGWCSTLPYKPVGGDAVPYPEELLQKSSSSNSSSEGDGQHPYGVDLSSLPAKRFVQPLTSEQLDSKLKRGA